MVKRGYNHHFRRIIELLHNVDTTNKYSSKINIALIVIAILTLSVATYFNIEMRNTTNETLEEMQKLVEWTLPKPIMIIEDTLPYIGKNNSIVFLVCDVEPDESFNNESIPIGKELKISFFNAGRIPLYNPRIYIKINTSSNVTFFPFKIRHVITTTSNLYYDGNNIKGLLWLNYPIGEPEQFSYCHPIDIATWTCGFPPTYVHNTNGTGMFFPMKAPIPYNLPDNEITNESTGVFKDNIGPFLLGDIDPAESKNCFIYLFAVADNHSEERVKSWMGERSNVYAEGNLQIIFKSENYEKIILNYPLISCFDESKI